MARIASLPAPVRPADLAAVRQLLKEWTLESYLCSKPPSTVVCLSDDMTVGQVLRLFAIHNILSAPIFEANSSRCSGFLDLVDILQAVLSWFNVRPENCERADKLKRAGRKLLTERIRSIKLANDGHLVYRNGASTTLLEVISSGFLQPVGSRDVSHRIAVWDYVTSPEDDDAAADEGGFGVYITNIISQSDIIRFLHQHSAQLGRLGSMSVEALGLATKQVVCVPSDMPTINAFAAMCASHVSSAGVVQLRGHGALVGNLSVSDLRGILPEHFSVLAQPVMTFLEMRRAGRCWAGNTPKNPRIQRPTNGCNGWGIKSAEGSQPVHVAACSPESTLLEVIEILVTTRYHRIYVTAEDRRPCGIITLTDILRLIAGRHLSLPKGAVNLEANIPISAAPPPRRSMSQPESMQAFRNLASPSPGALRAAQTAPNLELSSPQGSTDYLGQLLEMDLLGQLSAAGSEAESILQALRTISPAPPDSQPVMGMPAPPMPVSSFPATSKGSSKHLAQESLDPSSTGSISMSAGQEARQAVRGLTEPASQPAQPSEDEMDVAELMTFDEDSMLLPLPQEAHHRGVSSGRATPLARPPLRTESSPCSMADAFPSYPDVTILADPSLPFNPGPPDKQGMLSDAADGMLGSSISQPSCADASNPGTTSLLHKKHELSENCQESTERSGTSGARISSPWQAPWYYGRSSPSPSCAFLDTPLESSELEGYLEAGRFLSDSPAPSKPPSRPCSRARQGLSWQLGPDAASAAASDCQPVAMQNQHELSAAAFARAFAVEAGMSPSSPAAAAAAAAASSGAGPAKPDGLVMQHGSTAALADAPGLRTLPEGQPLSSQRPADASCQQAYDSKSGSDLSIAARSSSLPRIADLQLGSPQGSSPDLRALPFGDEPTSSSGALDRMFTASGEHAGIPGGDTGFLASEGSENPSNIMQGEVRGESPVAGQPVAGGRRRKDQSDLRGKARPVRQQHTFPHEAPSLVGSSRRKWCKVSSDSNLTGWERLS